MRAHRNPSARQVMAMLVAVAVLAQSVACSHAPARPDERDCAQERAEVLAGAKDQAKGRQAIFFNVTVDGRWRCAAAVPEQSYEVEVFVTWSDGTTERYGSGFRMNTEPGRQYSVLAYEVGVGHVPVNATLTAWQPSTSTPSFGDEWEVLRLPPFAVIAVAVVIVAIPFFIVAGITERIRKSKQAEAEEATRVRLATNCCYVWIEDAESRETIAGTAPSVR